MKPEIGMYYKDIHNGEIILIKGYINSKLILIDILNVGTRVKWGTKWDKEHKLYRYKKHSAYKSLLWRAINE